MPIKGIVNFLYRGRIVFMSEEKQQREVKHHRRRYRHARTFVVAALLAARDEHTVGIVDGDGGKHDENIHRLAPGVEGEADDKQHEVSQLQRHDVVQRQHDGQI